MENQFEEKNMGGLGGWIDFEKNLFECGDVARSMLDKLKERGSDSCGIYLQRGTMLMQSSFDEAEVNVPLKRSAKGEVFAIVCDGYLTNREDLKRELSLLGYCFFDGGDAELILCSYIEWGLSCLDRLEGAYSFAVWKERENLLFAARDRMGIKPLYYYSYGEGLAFASQIKALFKCPEIKAEVDENGLMQIFFLGPGKISGSGIYKDILELKPGECLVFDEGGLKTYTYWKLNAAPFEDTADEAAEKVRQRIYFSVKSLADSGFSVASMLSGGLDSSIVAAIAFEHLKSKGKSLSTFSVDYEGNRLNFLSNSFQPEADYRYIDLMGERLGSPHSEVVLNNLDLAGALREAAAARDLPGMGDIDSSLLLFAKEIAEGFPVCLSGECADELFGGYPWYHDEGMLNCGTFPWSRSLEMRKGLIRKGLIKAEPDGFVRDLYQKTIDETECLPQDSPGEKLMRQMFSLNFYWFMQTLIDRGDRMCAAAGLEMRMPFCDHRLAEYAFNMPCHIKNYGEREKGILRHAFKELLPHEVVWRKKSPFPKTFSQEYIFRVKKMLTDIIKGGRYLKELTDIEYLRKLYDLGPYSTAPWYGQLMRLPQLFAYLIQIEYVFEEHNVNLMI
jgi:asparagine synthase (glutamine-hydrolysing)